MFAYIVGLCQEPLLGGGCVGDGLLSGEGLRGDDEERRLGVQLLQSLGHVGPVDVGHEVNVWADLVGLQSFSGHQRTLET